MGLIPDHADTTLKLVLMALLVVIGIITNYNLSQIVDVIAWVREQVEIGNIIVETY